MKIKTILITFAVALTAIIGYAQDPAGPPPEGGGPGGGPGHKPGFHILPPHAEEQLKLTDDQKKQVADLEAEVKAKLEQILTPEQLEQLKQMHPPRPPGGKKGDGPGGAPGQPPACPPSTSGTTSGTSQ